MGKTVTADVGEAAVIQHFFHDVVAVGYDGDIDFSKGQIIFCIQFPAFVIAGVFQEVLDIMQIFDRFPGELYSFFLQISTAGIQIGVQFLQRNEFQLFSYQQILQIRLLTGCHIEETEFVFVFMDPLQHFPHFSGVYLTVQVLFFMNLIKPYKAVCDPGTGVKCNIQPLGISHRGQFCHRFHVFQHPAGIGIGLFSVLCQADSMRISHKKRCLHLFFQCPDHLTYTGLGRI